MYFVKKSSTVNCPTQGNQTITITLQQLFKGKLTSLIHLELFVHFKGETPQERINVDFEKMRGLHMAGRVNVSLC